MFRRLGLVLIVLGALAVVPVALAAYPSPYAAQGGQGVMSKDGSLRYVALKSGEDTTLRAVRTSDGSVAMSQPVAGLVRSSDAHRPEGRAAVSSATAARSSSRAPAMPRTRRSSSSAPAISRWVRRSR